jgi:hypothetical protein
MEFESALTAFFNLDTIADVEEYGSGHIHQTFLVSLKDNHLKYILQKLNTFIFTDVAALQANIEKVTDHIEKNTNDKDRGIRVVKSLKSSSFHVDGSGNYWRVFNFVAGSRTFDTIESTDLARQGGHALGKFLSELQGFPVEELHLVLPDFHNLDKRFRQFNDAVEADPFYRRQDIEEEIACAQRYYQKFKRFFASVHTDTIPVRLTHNDPKFNNILFDKQHKSICMIDLDTVMPGFVYYDFGDAIRTGAASGAEDEEDVVRMFFKLELFKAYAEGFLSETQGILTKAELSTLALAPQLMTFIIGLRFLTDYLNGDIYFKTHRTNHNLQRWFAQKALLMDMEAKEQSMREIINEIITTNHIENEE